MPLERLRVVAELPWRSRASERVDIEAAMAELEAAHAAGRRPRRGSARFLATRRLTSMTWTVEGRSPGDACRGAGSGPADHGAPAVEADVVAESFGEELPGGFTARYATTMDDVLEVVLPDVVGWPPPSTRAPRPAAAGETCCLPARPCRRGRGVSQPTPAANENAGREPAPAGPARRPSTTSPAALAAHLGRVLSAAAVDGNGWTDLHYAAALDGAALARALLAAGAPVDVVAWRSCSRAARTPTSSRRSCSRSRAVRTPTSSRRPRRGRCTTRRRATAAGPRRCSRRTGPTQRGGGTRSRWWRHCWTTGGGRPGSSPRPSAPRPGPRRALAAASLIVVSSTIPRNTGVPGRRSG